jgi:hypothetical protein
LNDAVAGEALKKQVLRCAQDDKIKTISDDLSAILGSSLPLAAAA